MKRKIIEISEEKCNGCGACVSACHEGAIGMVDGKAKLLRDDYCDGLGDCLPACPTGAITFVEREALPYDEEAVQRHLVHQKASSEPMPCGCPSTHIKLNERKPAPQPVSTHSDSTSQLKQWPVQIKLVPTRASFFHNAKLLIAADCTAFAVGDFHARFMKDKVTLIGCPKLDSVDYAEKLTEILKHNEIRSITVVRMEVPCCKGIVEAVRVALVASGKMIPWNYVVVSTDGQIIEE